MLWPMMDCFGWLFTLSRADLVMSHMMVDLNCMAIHTFAWIWEDHIAIDEGGHPGPTVSS